MHAMYFALAVIAGALLPVQGAMNAKLREHIGHPVLSALMNFAIGLLVLAIVAVPFLRHFTGMQRTLAAPWWAFVGGTIGAAFVLSAVVCIPRLGAVNLLVAALLGQMLASVVLDHQGWMGIVQRELTPMRIAGLVLVVVGVGLVQFSGASDR